jgi:hypothetical protein
MKINPPAPAIATSLDALETTQISLALPPLSHAQIEARWKDLDADLEKLSPPPLSLPPIFEGETRHPLEIQTKSQKIVHAPYAAERWHITNALFNADCPKLKKRSHRIGFCCQTPAVRLRAEKEPFPALLRCRDRLCSFCSEKRARACSVKATALVETFNAPRFITLTTKSRRQPLYHSLRHLLTAFARLRRTALWKTWVKAGIYALEVTYNPATRMWHPHLHIIADGEFIPQPQLKKLWQKLTGDSYIVHVKAIPDRGRAARYISAYVAKPLEVKSWDASAIREYASTLHGARMIQTFGAIKPPPPVLDEDPPEEAGTRHLVHGWQLINAEYQGCKPAATARQILARLGGEMAAAVGVSLDTLPREPEPPSKEELLRAIIIADRIKAAWPGLPSSLPFDDADSAKTCLAFSFPLATDTCSCSRCKADRGHEQPLADLETLFAVDLDHAEILATGP